jgi:small conductance mechanosensitive channel
MEETSQNLLSQTSKMMRWAEEYGPKIVGAVIALVVGLWLVNRLIKVMSMRMEQTKVDESLQPFLLSLSNVMLKAFVVLFSAGILGVQTASVLAVLGAAGFAVGLALQGSLGNFASGVLILFFRPYKVGDRITVHGFNGHVKEIQIFTTILITLDNREIIIPNSTITSGPIENLSSMGERRIDVQASLHPQENLSAVREIMQKVAKSSPGYLAENPIETPVVEIKTHAVIMALRYWVSPDLLEEAQEYAKEQIHEQFKVAGIKNEQDPVSEVKLIQP